MLFAENIEVKIWEKVYKLQHWIEMEGIVLGIVQPMYHIDIIIGFQMVTSRV